MTARAAHYRHIERITRVSGASPHRLIDILFDEVLFAIREVASTISLKIEYRVPAGRAQALLNALKASVDDGADDKLAGLLLASYKQAGDYVGRATSELDPIWCDRATDIIAPLAVAWKQIRPACDAASR